MQVLGLHSDHAPTAAYRFASSWSRLGNSRVSPSFGGTEAFFSNIEGTAGVAAFADGPVLVAVPARNKCGSPWAEPGGRYEIIYQGLHRKI